MSTRTTRKTTTNAIITEEQMREALRGYVQHYCEHQKIEAAAKARVEAVKLDANVKMLPHIDALDAHEAVIALYVEQHRAEFCEPHPRKKEIYGGHKIGLQTGQPSVTFIKPTGEKGRQTEEGFIERIRGTAEFEAFVRTIEHVDKDSIITERRKYIQSDDADVAEFDNALAALGVKVSQKETVVIDLNLQPDAAA